MVDNKVEGLVTQSPSLLGYHEVRRLRGQTMPALATHQLDRRDVDILLIAGLLKRWERCFANDSPSIEDERLFRSLNMANAAAMLPAGADAKLYDIVRSVALWAGAFDRPSSQAAASYVCSTAVPDDPDGLPRLEACSQKT